MRKHLRALVVALLLFVLSPAQAWAAARYWVGGTGNWSDATNHWSDTDGGTPNASFLPTASDDVFFTTLSHTVGYTVTIDATTKLCNDLTFAAPLTGNVALAGTTAMTVSGSMTLYSGMSITYSGTITFDSGASETIDAAGAYVGTFSIAFNNAAGDWTLASAWTGSPLSSVITVTAGSFSTNNHNVDIGRVATNGALTRSISLGSSTVTTGSSQGWAINGTTNLTFNAGTSSLACGSNTNAFGVGLTFYDMSFTSNAGSHTGSGTANNMSFSGGGFHWLGGNWTVAGTLSVTGVNGANLTRVISDTRGTQRTITAAVVSVSNAGFQDVVAAGAGDWDISASNTSDFGNNSGITFTAAANVYWVGGTGSWSDTAEWSSSSGGAGGYRVPLAQDTAVFDSNSFSAGSQTVTANVGTLGTVDFSAVTNSPTLALGTTIFYSFGSITLSASMSVTGTTPRMFYQGSGTSTLTTAGIAWPSTHTTDALTLQSSGTLALGSALTIGGAINVTAGTFDTGGFSVTSANLTSNSSTFTRAISLGASTWTLTSGTVNPWSVVAENLTLTAGNSTIKLTGTLTAARTFAGAGLTYYNVWNATTGAFAVQFTGSNTFNEVRHDSGRTWQLTAGTTTTLASLVADGVTIGSITAASHTLAKTGGGTIAVDGVTVSRSTASPPSTFYATGASTDGGNNVDWTFGPAPVTTKVIVIQ